MSDSGFRVWGSGFRVWGVCVCLFVGSVIGFGNCGGGVVCNAWNLSWWIKGVRFVQKRLRAERLSLCEADSVMAARNFRSLSAQLAGPSVATGPEIWRSGACGTQCRVEKLFKLFIVADYSKSQNLLKLLILGYKAPEEVFSLLFAFWGLWLDLQDIHVLLTFWMETRHNEHPGQA